MGVALIIINGKMLLPKMKRHKNSEINRIISAPEHTK
jgi:hypothetical protein